jgi:hypothetical protein
MSVGLEWPRRRGLFRSDDVLQVGSDRPVVADLEGDAVGTRVTFSVLHRVLPVVSLSGSAL